MRSMDLRREKSIRARRENTHGYTLLELTLVALVAISILAIAIPITNNALEGYRYRSAVQSSVAIIQSTRYQAIMRGNPMALEYSAGSNLVQVYEQPAGAAGFVPLGDPLPVGRLAFSDSGRLVFFPNGRVEAAAGAMALSVEKGDLTSTIEVSRFGNVRVQTP
jgi:Tfp pilus assembly protein FimT